MNVRGGCRSVTNIHSGFDIKDIGVTFRKPAVFPSSGKDGNGAGFRKCINSLKII